MGSLTDPDRERIGGPIGGSPFPPNGGALTPDQALVDKAAAYLIGAIELADEAREMLRVAGYITQAGTVEGVIDTIRPVLAEVEALYG